MFVMGNYIHCTPVSHLTQDDVTNGQLIISFILLSAVLCNYLSVDGLTGQARPLCSKG